MLTDDLHSRARGALLGLAAGDALGATLEFTPPGPHGLTDMIGGGPHNLAPGQWTDDASMALCLASSLVDLGRFDPADQMRRYLRWRDEGYLSSTGHCFDIGNTVSGALRRFEQTEEPYAGPTDPLTAGSGSLMRLAPVPLFYHRDAHAAITYAALSSRTTHGAPAAVDACRYYAGLIWGALHGVDRAALLSPGYAPVPALWTAQPLVPEIEAIAQGSFERKEPPEIEGSGYVVRSLEAALCAFARSSSFAEGALLAANLGQDADTTAAIFGQLAGAYYGEGGIPAAWRERLVQHELIASLAEALIDAGPA